MSAAQENTRGLPPADNATYIPKLGGLLNKTMHNQYGQKKDLAECVVLRGSSGGKQDIRAGRRAFLRLEHHAKMPGL